MRKRLIYGSLSILLAISVILVVWEGSFNPGNFRPANPNQTLIFWAVSSLIFLLMVTLGWILTREFVKLYVERQSRREGSRIKTKLVVGALALSFVPVFFLVLFSYEVMNRNIATWFRQPAANELTAAESITRQLGKEMQDETNAQAALLAAQWEVRQLIEGGARTPGFLARFARTRNSPPLRSTAPRRRRRSIPGGPTSSSRKRTAWFRPLIPFSAANAPSVSSP